MHLRCLALISFAAAVPLAAQQSPRAWKGKLPPELPYKVEFDFPFKFEMDGFKPGQFDFDFPFTFEMDGFKPGEFDFDVPFKYELDAMRGPDFELDPGFKLEPGFPLERLGPRGQGWLHRVPQQGTPEDSAYRAARNVLSRYEYRRASELLGSFVTKYPKSRYSPAAMYWRAFALYRVGTPQELALALRVLDEQRQQYPEAVEDPDVSGLTTRVLGALAGRGDADATRRLQQQTQQGVQSCDKEDMEVRAEALSALVQSDPASAAPVLRRILARRDECSAPLRRRAVYLLGREGVGGTPEDLVEVAKNDPDGSVRSDALSRLAQMPGDGPIRQLDLLLVGSSDERTQRAALAALRRSDHPDAQRILRRAVEREDLNENVRAEAIRSLGRRQPSGVVFAERPGSAKYYRQNQPTLTAEEVTLLRGIYDKSTSRTVRSAILESIARGGGAAGDQWLTSIVRDQNQELRHRSAALGRLRRSDVPIEELSKLYDALSERELRSELIRILGQREEPAATDKLFEIAKTGTDPVIRRSAINALSRKKDPRTTKLLLDMVER
ncbi:MAG TPA: HEAT repeat domain-containing protein [Gemmatimonadales bacterium]